MYGPYGYGNPYGGRRHTQPGDGYNATFAGFTANMPGTFVAYGELDETWGGCQGRASQRGRYQPDYPSERPERPRRRTESEFGSRRAPRRSSPPPPDQFQSAPDYFMSGGLGPRSRAQSIRRAPPRLIDRERRPYGMLHAPPPERRRRYSPPFPDIRPPPPSRYPSPRRPSPYDLPMERSRRPYGREEANPLPPPGRGFFSPPRNRLRHRQPPPPSPTPDPPGPRPGRFQRFETRFVDPVRRSFDRFGFGRRSSVPQDYPDYRPSGGSPYVPLWRRSRDGRDRRNR